MRATWHFPLKCNHEALKVPPDYIFEEINTYSAIFAENNLVFAENMFYILRKNCGD